MFLNEKYVLTNELVEKLGIAQSNISQLRNKLEEQGDTTTIEKIGIYNYTILNTKSPNIPNTLNRPDIFKGLTPLYNKLPANVLAEEYGLTPNDLKILGGTLISVLDKDWYVFEDEFVKTMKNAIPYVLNDTELAYCSAKKQIDGALYLSPNRHFTWYYIR